MSSEKDLETEILDYASRLDNITQGDMTEALNVLVLFFKAKGLNVNFSLVLASNAGLASIGNLTPDLQLAAFTMLGRRLEESADEINDALRGAKANAAH